MDTERLDLSALDLGNDELRHERMVRNIRRRAAPELARRAMVRSPVRQLAEWMRPALVAASLVGLIASTALFMTERAVANGIAEYSHSTNGVVSLLIGDGSWLPDDPLPTVDDIMVALDDGLQ